MLRTLGTKPARNGEARNTARSQRATCCLPSRLVSASAALVLGEPLVDRAVLTDDLPQVFGGLLV